MMRTTTRPSRSRRKNNLFGRILQKIRGSPKTVQVEKKKQSRLTHFQITKIYRLWDEPNKDGSKKYTLNQISLMVGASQQCIRYWIDKRDEQKPGITKSNQAIDKALKQGEEDIKFDEKGKWIKVKDRKKKTTDQVPTEQATPIDIQTEEQATIALAEVITKDKYWVENQANPEVFKTNPPQATATLENYKEQKNRNNANRATVWKVINSKEEARNIGQEDYDKAFKSHSKKEPKDHYGYPHKPNRCCCGVNEPDWVKIHPVLTYDQWKTGNHRQNWEKKKYAERMKAEQEAREQGIKPDYHCSVCNSQITAQQSRTTSQNYGKFYCSKHEPNQDGFPNGII